MTNSYESPFCTRYASKEMQFIFSADKKFTTWRKLWVALARAEMKLGLNVTQEQVDELEQGRPIDLAHACVSDLPKDGQDRRLNAGGNVGHGAGR